MLGYDTPIQLSLYHYYEEIIELMREFLSNLLKGNGNIHRSVVMGILRITRISKTALASRSREVAMASE